MVEAVGSGVAEIAVGDRVATLSSRSFAGADVADADKVVKLPSELGDQPFPGEPLGCAFNIFRRSEISGPGRRRRSSGSASSARS